MAQIYSPKPRKNKQFQQKLSVEVDSVDHQGQGVANWQGKVVFVPGVLPGERADIQLTENKARYAKGRLIKIDRQHTERVKPDCKYFGRCGGCQLQYAPLGLQRHLKQQALGDLMEKLAGLAPTQWAEPIVSPDWGYRRRARIGAQWVKGRLVLGFRRASTNDLIDIDGCPVLAPSLSALLPEFRAVLSKLKLARQLGHIDLYLANEGDVAVLRLTAKPPASELLVLAELKSRLGITILIRQSQLTDLHGASVTPLHYTIGEDLPDAAFLPGDFFQVNDFVNQQMVQQALDWLKPTQEEKGLDLFCGGGNFTFALATKSKQVIGVEGVEAMVERARCRAKELELTHVDFYCADLNGEPPQAEWLKQVDWALLDPARAGAEGAMQWLADIKPSRVLYVSCHPASLARDAKTLAGSGYRLEKLGLVDMFPHTQHLESMALFVPQDHKG